MQKNRLWLVTLIFSFASSVASAATIGVRSSVGVAPLGLVMRGSDKDSFVPITQPTALHFALFHLRTEGIFSREVQTLAAVKLEQIQRILLTGRIYWPFLPTMERIALTSWQRKDHCSSPDASSIVYKDPVTLAYSEGDTIYLCPETYKLSVTHQAAVLIRALLESQMVSDYHLDELVGFLFSKDLELVPDKTSRPFKEFEELIATQHSNLKVKKSQFFVVKVGIVPSDFTTAHRIPLQNLCFVDGFSDSDEQFGIFPAEAGRTCESYEYLPNRDVIAVRAVDAPAAAKFKMRGLELPVGPIIGIYDPRDNSLQRLCINITYDGGQEPCSMVVRDGRLYFTLLPWILEKFGAALMAQLHANSADDLIRSDVLTVDTSSQILEGIYRSKIGPGLDFYIANVKRKANGSILQFQAIQDFQTASLQISETWVCGTRNICTPTTQPGMKLIYLQSDGGFSIQRDVKKIKLDSYTLHKPLRCRCNGVDPVCRQSGDFFPAFGYECSAYHAAAMRCPTTGGACYEIP